MMPGRVSINFTRLLFTFKCQHQGSLKIEFILHFPAAESNGNPFGSILIAFTYLNLILLVVASRRRLQRSLWMSHICLRSNQFRTKHTETNRSRDQIPKANQSQGALLWHDEQLYWGFCMSLLGLYRLLLIIKQTTLKPVTAGFHSTQLRETSMEQDINVEENPIWNQSTLFSITTPHHIGDRRFCYPIYWTTIMKMFLFIRFGGVSL